MKWDKLWVNARIATLTNNNLIEHGAIAVNDKKIAWIGEKKDLPASANLLAEKVYDAQNLILAPGLIDCHTHLVYAGNRANEFALRLQGASYEEIAKSGGGIQSTVKATRAASEKELLAQSVARARALLAEGVTTLEIKSGYGLDIETELKILRVAKRIAELLPIKISLTFLGAHALPEEFNTKPDEYIDFVCHEMLPAIVLEKLAQNIDVFCETIAFSAEQSERIFKAAKEFGLNIKCHAEQLSNLGASKLAAKYGAISVDHLEYLTEEDVIALAKAGTTAVLLPGAYYFLREKQLPPIDLLRKHKVPIAIATDCNPGTSPCTSLLLIMNMACTLFHLTPEEALRGVTVNAAKALGLAKSRGSLEVGKFADFTLWNVKSLDELSYFIGFNPLVNRVFEGILIE